MLHYLIFQRMKMVPKLGRIEGFQESPNGLRQEKMLRSQKWEK